MAGWAQMWGLWVPRGLPSPGPQGLTDSWMNMVLCWRPRLQLLPLPQGHRTLSSRHCPKDQPSLGGLCLGPTLAPSPSFQAHQVHGHSLPLRPHCLSKAFLFLKAQFSLRY